MKKRFQKLVVKLNQEGGASLSGRFTMIRGGKLSTNTGDCNNSGTSCSGSNSGNCNNAGTCTNATNGGTCTANSCPS